ncbi:hypothetical protein LguiA_004723 [Lonicera macranthoides]
MASCSDLLLMASSDVSFGLNDQITMSFPANKPSPPVIVVTPNTSNLPRSPHNDSSLSTDAHAPPYVPSVQPTLPQVLHSGHNIDPTPQNSKPSLEEISHLLALQTQNQQKIMVEQSQQQQLLFHLLSKLALQHCTASANPHTTSTVSASMVPASSAVYAADSAFLMKENVHVSKQHAVEGTLLLQGCQHTSNSPLNPLITSSHSPNATSNFSPLNGDYSATNSLQISPISQISQDYLGAITSSSRLKGIPTPAPHHSIVSIAAAPQQPSLDIDSELVHVLQQQKSKALEATSNGADGQPFSALTHQSLFTAQNSASASLPANLSAQSIGKSMAMSYANALAPKTPTTKPIKPQLPVPQKNGNLVTIKLDEQMYQKAIQKCSTNLLGRLILHRGLSPLKAIELQPILTNTRKLGTNWSFTPIGRGKQKQSTAHVWARIHDLPLEYFDEDIVMSIVGLAFEVPITYEELPPLCSHCSIIGHLVAECRVLMKAHQNHSLNQSVKEGNKGKFNKGIDASGLPSSSKPVVASEQVEPTFALNVQESAPSTSKLPLSNTTAYTASSPTFLEPINVLPSISLDTIVTESSDMLQTQSGTQQPLKQKLDISCLLIPKNHSQLNSNIPETANKFAPLSGIFWDDDDSDDHLVEQVPSSPPHKIKSPSHNQFCVALEQDKGPPILGSSNVIHNDNFSDESISNHDICSSPSKNLSSDSDYIPSTSDHSQKYRLMESDYLPVNKPISNKKKLKKQAQKNEAIRLELHEAGLSPQVTT